MANQYRDRDRQGYDRNRGERNRESDRVSGWDIYRNRDEDYFGSGRMQYGQGNTGGYDRDFTDERSDFATPSRSYTGGYGADVDRGSHQREGDYYRRSNPNREYSRSDRYDSDYGFSGWPDPSRSGFEQSGYTGYGGGESAGRYRSDYPSSERGYDQRGGERGWWDKTSDEVASWFGDDEAARRREQDHRREGGHRGRGPSNYQRSDERITEDVNDRLTDSWYVDASNIEVEVSGGDVTLTGTVESRQEKRQAEEIAEDVSGVKNVENRLRVSTVSNRAELSPSPTVQTAAPPDTANSPEQGRSKTASRS